MAIDIKKRLNFATRRDGQAITTNVTAGSSFSSGFTDSNTYATNALSASYAETASLALNVVTASWALNADTLDGTQGSAFALLNRPQFVDYIGIGTPFETGYAIKTNYPIKTTGDLYCNYLYVNEFQVTSSFQLPNGTISLPSLTFLDNLTVGLYKDVNAVLASAGDFRAQHWFKIYSGSTWFGSIGINPNYTHHRFEVNAVEELYLSSAGTTRNKEIKLDAGNGILTITASAVYGITGYDPTGSAESEATAHVSAHESTYNHSNYNTAYSDRMKWDGGDSGLNAANGRSNLGLGSIATKNTDDYLAYRTFGTAANNNTGDFATAGHDHDTAYDHSGSAHTEANAHVTAHENTYNHSNYNTAYSHASLITGNPHGTTYAEVSAAPNPHDNTYHSTAYLATNGTAYDSTRLNGQLSSYYTDWGGGTFTGKLYVNTTGGNSYCMNSAGTYYATIQNDAGDKWSLGYTSAVATLGTPVLTWTPTGVGIGTTAPLYKTHIVQSTTGGVLKIANSNYNRAIIMGADSGYGNEPYIQAVVNDSDVARQLSINPNGGNVGIGTTAPIGKLDVRGGDIYVSNSDWNGVNTGSAIAIYRGAATGNTYSGLQGYNAGGSTVGIISLNPVGGNLGIGTVAPSAKLDVEISTDILATHIHQTKNDGGSSYLLDIRDTRGYAGNNSGNCIYVQAYNDNATNTGNLMSLNTLHYQGSDVPVLVAKLNGNVGIGTATPTAYTGYLTLQIGDNASGRTGVIKLSSTYNSGNGAEIYQATADGKVYFNTNSATTGMTLTAAGALTVTSTVTATNFILSSDLRIKQLITPIKNTSVDVEYKQFELINEPGVTRYGVVAQDLQKTHPELVREGKDGLLSVAYIDLFVKEIDYLKNRIKHLEERIK